MDLENFEAIKALKKQKKKRKTDKGNPELEQEAEPAPIENESKKKKKFEKGNLELELEAEPAPVENESKKSKKKKKSEKTNPELKLEAEPEPEPELAPVENDTKKKKKKRKSEKIESIQQSDFDPNVENATPKFGKRTKGEINNNTSSPSKSDKEVSDSSFSAASATPKFGRRSKGEVNNSTPSPSKSDKGEKSDSSFALPIESKKKKRKASEADETPNFERTSKGEFNNSTPLTSKSVKEEIFNSSFASPIESKKKKRKSSEVDDTLLPDVDTTVEAEFESPSKKLKIGNKDFMKDCEKLLSVAAEIVPHDSKPYNQTLLKFDYSKLAKHLPGRSPQDVKNDLLFLIEATEKRKCLHQLLTEALEEIKSERSVMGGFSSFLHANSDKIMEEARSRGLITTPLIVATEMWKNLPAKEKLAYKGESKGRKTTGHSPYDIFYALLKTKEPKISAAESRNRFKNLPIEKKVKYIKKSAKEMMKANEDKERKQEEEENYSSKTLEKKPRGPTKDEVELYLKHFGYPDEPTSHLPSFYCNEKKIPLNSNKSRLMATNEAFYGLSKEKQDHWKMKHKKVEDKFMAQVEEWKNNQDKVTLFIWKTFKEPVAVKIPQKNQKTTTTKITKTTGKFNVKDYIMHLTYTDVQVKLAKFDGEPVMPPLDPVKLFGLELEKRRNQKYTIREIKSQFSALDKTKKATFEKTCDEIKEQFINGLKDFVGNLSYEQRKLFLGVNRIKYIKALQQDIFEEDYPHSEYKVFLTSNPKEASNTKSVKKNSKHSQNNKGTDKDEEEEDIEDFQSPKSSKLVKPRNYSSRKETKKELKSQEESSDENDNDDDDGPNEDDNEVDDDNEIDFDDDNELDIDEDDDIDNILTPDSD